MREFIEKIAKKCEKIKILKWCFDLYLKYIEIWNYLICGGISTIVNIAAYAIAEKVWKWNNVIVSTLFAWILGVIVAYILNKVIVFETKNLTKKELLKEIWSFFMFRVFSGVLDIVFMKVTVDILKWNDILMKVISNIIVIVLNYIFSKLFIFKKTEKKE